MKGHCIIKSAFYGGGIIGKLLYFTYTFNFYLAIFMTFAKRKSPLPNGDVWVKLSFVSLSEYHFTVAGVESCETLYDFKTFRQKLALI